MPSDVRVRQARAEDADGFVRAYEAAWDASLGPIVGRTLAELASFESRLESFRAGLGSGDSRNAQILVAERGRTIVGIAVGVAGGDGTGELRDLYVVPEAWGSGVAVALCERAIDRLHALGCSELVLWVVDGNGRARRFYEREGWIADGETRASALGPLEVRYRRAV